MHFSYASRKENYLEITWFIQLEFYVFLSAFNEGEKDEFDFIAYFPHQNFCPLSTY